ncbi:hypothetical protein [Streptomyces sp. NPDC000229]|uniref:hypothetical protein n=1 Tax=Streptomyces sp. NPDC000229 TaxID=3154247 RepID=UPI0033246E21
MNTQPVPTRSDGPKKRVTTALETPLGTSRELRGRIRMYQPAVADAETQGTPGEGNIVLGED